MKMKVEIQIDLPSEFVDWLIDNQYEIKSPFDIYGREVWSRMHSAVEEWQSDLQDASGIDKSIECVVIDRS